MLRLSVCEIMKSYAITQNFLSLQKQQKLNAMGNGFLNIFFAALVSVVFLNSASAYAQSEPGDTSDIVIERRDTLQESRITGFVDRDANSTQTGMTRLDASKFRRGFYFLSSPDVIKTLQILPGVSAGTELMSGLYVHGGTGSDNLFLLDGVPLYQVSHLAGLFSSFNTEIVDNLDFYKSGFPARYGGRLSSVVDVSTRTGDMEEYHGMFSIGLIDGNIQFEGPIIKGRTSFNVALRRTWLDVVTTPALLILNKKHSGEEQVMMNYAFWDGNAGITHRIDRSNTLALNFYMGRDNLGIKMTYPYEDTESDPASKVKLNWGNILTSLKWDSMINDGLQFRTTLYHSNNRSRIAFIMDEFSGTGDDMQTLNVEAANMTRVNDFGLKTDFDWIPSTCHHVRFGASYQFHTYHPERSDVQSMSQNGKEQMRIESGDDSRYWGHEPSLYIEDEISASRWFKANVGMRYALFGVKGKVYNAFEPRVALRFQYADWMSVRASYTEMNQFNHQVATNYMDLPTNTWMPVTAKVRPMHSRQVAGGFYMNFPHGIVLNLEGYWKTMEHLLEYTGANAFYPPLTAWEYSFSEGRGRSYGLEAELAWRTDRTDIAAYYTLSWNERYFEEIYPVWYPDRHDNRHKLTLVASHRFGKKCDIYAAWNYHSGNKVTAYSHVVSENWTVDVDDAYYGTMTQSGYDHDYYYTAPNNVSMPAYHRLDIGFNFRKTTKRGNESVWNLSIYNVYCRMNPFYAIVTTDEEGNFVGTGYGIIPIIPSFSYTIRF